MTSGSWLGGTFFHLSTSIVPSGRMGSSGLVSGCTSMAPEAVPFLAASIMAGRSISWSALFPDKAAA